MSAVKKELYSIKGPTSGELFILEFFERNNIKYEREKVINGLKGDIKNFRRADFYLPNIKLYVEYFGCYNATSKHRKAYENKVSVYLKNSIPTVFLYPEELGIIDYAFNQKAVKLLKTEKFNLRSQLCRYRLNRFDLNRSEYTLRFLFIFVSAFILGIISEGFNGLTLSERSVILIIGLYIIGCILYDIFDDVRRCFYLDK